jgi:hypothetical protein
VDQCDYLTELATRMRKESEMNNFELWSETRKIFFAVWKMDTELFGGGFDQFLRCCDSPMISYTPTALKAIGAADCAAIVERAIRMIEPIPSTQEERFEKLDDIGEDGEDELVELDEAYDECDEDVIGMLFDFVAKHPEEFGAVPEAE